MKDENGKAVGVLAHIVKTHVSESSDEDIICTLSKNLNDIKIDDQMSNEDILSYTNPKSKINKGNSLLDAIDATSDKENFKPSKTSKDNKNQLNISVAPNTSDITLMH